MTYRILGAATLVVGLLLWLTMVGAFAFREAFGGERVSGLWYLLPALITFGGPILFWVVLPRRDKERKEQR